MNWKHENEEWNDWRSQLRRSITTYAQAGRLLGMSPHDPGCKKAEAVCERYRCRITPYYLSLIESDMPDDPIRLQCMPDERELECRDGGTDDPFGETSAGRPAGIVHRYPDRVLLAAANICAVYCRHCTRKNTLESYAVADRDKALEYIRSNPSIREVLISGGDPLLLETAKLDSLLAAVQAIEHIEVVRIGTRVPVVLPMRVDDELADMLAARRPLWVNTQFNHPRELTPQAVSACRRLIDRGIPVSNQSVLLKGVNDDFTTMRDLCAALQRNLIRPYYVFMCDPVAGIEHFRTSPEEARILERRLRESLGGLAMPRFVADVPGSRAKVPLGEL